MTNTITTKRINNGHTVLAYEDRRYGVTPFTFANVTQAERRVAEFLALGFNVWVAGRRPFFVAFNLKAIG